MNLLMASDGTKLPQFNTLLQPDAYPHAVDGEVLCIETHISWVFLAGDFAYKLKKPIRNNFLDYSSLSLRKYYCDEEMRLNRRFADDIYLGVVPIVARDGKLRVGMQGEPIEFALKMRRFPADAILSNRIAHDLVDIGDVRSLATRIAEFHYSAAEAEASSRFGTPDLVYAEAQENCRDIGAARIARIAQHVGLLANWTDQYFETHKSDFLDRKRQGHIRECHGDLHLGNIVNWKRAFIPFDGIEFCEDFRWIDTLSDAAFTAMDFAAHGRQDFCHSFVNAYFEATGDYSGINVLQWYLVYRAMVRAKVATIRLAQTDPGSIESESVEREIDSHLALAARFSRSPTSKPSLWITYGVSGSGKTTGSERVLQRHGALRIRADVERKRLAGLKPEDRVHYAALLYSDEMTSATYQRLVELAEQIIKRGLSVIVDATFLMKWQRQLFHELASRLHVPFRILAFDADFETLRQRVAQRLANNSDASDADLVVLESQLENRQHLDIEELNFVDADAN